MITRERLPWNTLVATLVAAATLCAAVDKDSGEGFFGEVELIAESEGVCSGSKCGLCDQPCADACCGTDEGKPECCSQHETVKIAVPFVMPRVIKDTPCPPCALCKSLMAQAFVDPKLAECCNAVPCGSMKAISNTVPDPPQNVVEEGKNPYGASWTYEKHVKKNGIDTSQFINAPPIVKASVAQAAKAAQEVQDEMKNTNATNATNSNETNSSPSNSSGMNTSHTPGTPVLLMPPGVDVDDWLHDFTKAHALHGNGTNASVLDSAPDAVTFDEDNMLQDEMLQFDEGADVTNADEVALGPAYEYIDLGV